MRLDPRVKLLLIVCLTTLSVLCIDILYLLAVAVISFIIDLMLKVDLKAAWNRIKQLFAMIIFIALVQSLAVKGGPAIIHIGQFNLLTLKGILYGAEFLLRMSIIILAGLIAASCKGREMTDGLIKLGLPYELAFMTSVAIRFIPVFREEFSNRLSAISMRGIVIKKLRLNKKIKLYSYLMSPVILSSVLRSEELARAMTARGFRAYGKRTMLRELRMTAADYCVLILAVSAFAAFLYFMYSIGEIVAM